MIFANPCSCCSNICNTKNLPKICPKPAAKTCQKSAWGWCISTGSMKNGLGRLLRSCCGQMSGRFLGLQIDGPMLANQRPNVCKSATHIGQQTLFSGVRNCRTVDLQWYLQILAAVVQIFATPKICPTSARNLPRRLVKKLPEAYLHGQAQWKLIWADLWAAVAGRFRADVVQVFQLANRRPNACKPATQCLQIGDPYWTTNPVFTCSNL